MSPKGDRDADAGFAGRWSKLKQDARKPAQPLETEPEAALPTGADAPADERSDAEILEALGLPDPDTLKPGDDFAAFMAKAVPARLRSRALRKLWISNPVLANLDELIDYGEDFTDAATVIENLTTGYQVGKGWADKLIETPKPLSAVEDDDPDADEADAGEGVAETPPETATEADAATEIPPPGAPEEAIAAHKENRPEVLVAPQQFPSRRRMRFRMAED